MADNKQKLSGKRVAMLVADGFEQVEMTSPKEALEAAGATVEIVSPSSDSVRGWQHTEWGDTFAVDHSLDNASPDNYDALVLPGGVMNPDTLRQNDQAVQFVKHFGHEGKPIAAICHGPWTLIEAGLVEDRQMTSYGSIRTDLQNAGAKWVDEEVVVDKGLVTSRSPKDLDAFNSKAIEEIAEGIHTPAS